MTARVELIYDRDCPNIGAARAVLAEALAKAGLPRKWTEWDRQAPASPAYVRGYGSPTILVDGADVGGARAADAASCRVYAGDGAGLSGTPSVEQLTAALVRTRARAVPPAGTAGGRVGAFGWLPAAATALLPVGTCPACWPAYAGALSAAGAGFVFEPRYALPITAAAFAAAVGSIGLGVRRGHGAGPLALGIAGSLVALVARFALAADLLFYAGLTAVIGASFWNAFRRRGEKTCACARVAPRPETPAAQRQ